MKECTYGLMVGRLHALGKTFSEIEEIINMAKEYSKTADAVYIWHKDEPDTVIQCQFVDGIARWFMQG